MTTSKLSFYQQHLAIEPEVKDKLKKKLETLKQEDFLYPKTDIVYKVTSKKYENQIFALSIKHGNQHPYGDEVIDIKNNTSVANPKSENQIELKEQFFIAYCFKQNILFSSKITCSKLLLNTLFKEDKIDIKTNPIIANIGNLKEKFKKISQIQITKKPVPDLFNDFLTNDIYDPEGLGQKSTQIELKLTFDNTPFGELFNGVKKEYEKGNRDFMIKGWDENNEPAQFVNNMFIKSISLDNLEKDSYDLYKEEDVLEKLIKKITELKNEKTS